MAARGALSSTASIWLNLAYRDNYMDPDPVYKDHFGDQRHEQSAMEGSASGIDESMSRATSSWLRIARR